ncbi:hypothetical protein Tco_0183214 [Tanacetum coccineum]
MMADQRTMEELLHASTEGYAEAIIVPPIPAEHFELQHSLINLITSTLKYKDVLETSIKLMLFPFSIDGPARIWLDKEPSRSILTWDDLLNLDALCILEEALTLDLHPTQLFIEISQKPIDY